MARAHCEFKTAQTRQNASNKDQITEGRIMPFPQIFEAFF